MTDLTLALSWTLALAAGLGAAVVVHRLGVATTYVRDLLHVGAGVWVLGWPMWRSPVPPVLLVATAFVITLAVPRVAGRLSAAAHLQASVTNGEERWTGLVRYTTAYLLFTPIGLAGDPFAAGAALWSVSLGDGIGGAVGRRFGRHHFAVPGGKRKSLEGSLAVAAAAGAGALLLGAWFGVSVAPATALLVAAVAALAEALSPASSDNLVVPVAVWLALALQGAWS